MKIFLISIALTFALIHLTSAELSPEEEERIFNHWLRKHKIKLPNSEEAKKWKQNVIKRLNDIEEHNENFRSGKVTFERELNHLSHLHLETLRSTKHGVKIPDNYKPDPSSFEEVVARSKRASDGLPRYLNWADRGIVQPVQNQEQCGSCYAFAGIAAMEAHACRYLRQCEKLSEQEAMECTDGCKGGWDDYIYTYAKNKGGCTTESSYKYKGDPVNTCDADTSANTRAKNTVAKSWKNMPNDEYTIRHNLYKKGPLWVTFQVYDNFYDYKGGIFNSPQGNVSYHAVLMTGYGEQNGSPYWILKNSWGPDWGEKGYFRIARGVDMCKVESIKLSYPIME